MYPESQKPDAKLVLLDGQQRLSTIQQYKTDPLKFWKPLNLESYKDALVSVNNILSDDKQINEKTFDELVNEKRNLADWADEAVDRTEDRKPIRDLIKVLRAEVAKYVDLESLKILAIKFIGSRDSIADVFANLNKGGIPLSKYEIYNAAWVNTEISLLSKSDSEMQDEILGYVKDYYAEMESSAEFELNDFSEDELSRTRAITLSEFGHALGAIVGARLGPSYPRRPTRKRKSDLAFSASSRASTTASSESSVPKPARLAATSSPSWSERIGSATTCRPPSRSSLAA